MQTRSEFYAWLMDRVNDRGGRSLNELSSFVRDERELLLKAPAMAAMLVWGEIGCEAIVQTALANPTSKNVSGAYKCLCAAADGNAFAPALMFIDHDPLIKAIDAVIAGRRLQTVARNSLLDLMQSLDVHDLLIPLGVAFTQMGVSGGYVASELVRAMSSRWLHLGPSVLREYDLLIKASASDEPAFQDFFCNHPQMLDPMALQVWSQPDFHGAYEPDFVIRRADDSYLIVEIETPNKPLTTQAGQLTADVTHAEKQVTDYRAFLNERVGEAQKHFPHYSGADCLTVIGLENNLSPQQLRSVTNANAGRHAVRIVGFDWLAKRARAIIDNLSTGEIEISQGHRLI